MQNKPIVSEKKLPTLNDLIAERVDREEYDQLNVLLNQPPPEKWLKQHPLAKNVKYIPIERIEFLLTKLFQNWRVEIKEVQVMANSVVVLVRLHYQDILTAQWTWQDGVGAAPIQTDSGAGAMDWNKAKSDGVMKAAPAAESYAVKDAAEKIGKIFGKDLNRKDEMGYNSLIKEKEDKHTQIFEGNER